MFNKLLVQYWLFYQSVYFLFFIILMERIKSLALQAPYYKFLSD